MATIIGMNKKLNVECNSHLLQIRYGAADAKVALQQYVKANPALAKTPLTKKYVMEIFFKNPLGYMPRKSMKSLCEFLFNQAVKNNYIVIVPKIWATDEQEYIVSPTINEKRPGPKKRQIWNNHLQKE